MSESAQHISFVSNLYNYVCENIVLDNIFLIEVDLPQMKYRPQKGINGFIPDLYYNYNNLLVIGEAKTEKDVDRDHSISQYKSYYNEAILFDGEAVLVFFVPWISVSTLKNILRKMKKERPSDVRAIIVSDNKCVSEL